jgi:hypothetical protein
MRERVAAWSVRNEILPETPPRFAPRAAGVKRKKILFSIDNHVGPSYFLVFTGAPIVDVPKDFRSSIAAMITLAGRRLSSWGIGPHSIPREMRAC